ncbi:ATP-binding protein [Alkalihalophilus pseudofirmus]|uniref:ATP-binding protein n=1 Tax=Alkalihalophilus pseudofirmus TaxID=79885 RepID=UPI00130540EA|nr:sensor histidine kinase [Alkalihalophilus pseudofirmus]
MHNSVEESVGNYTLKVAQILSKMDVVEETLKAPPKNNNLQSSYENYLKEVSTSDQIFMVLINQEGLRYTHPNNNLIGKHITGDDINEALNGKTYISKAKGISGTTIRTFVPIVDSNTNKQIGVISIGISQSNLTAVAKEYVQSLFFWILVTLLIGFLASIILSKRIKKVLHGFEPNEIASLFREKDAILESMSEGIIAIDNDQRIILVNKSAQKLLSLEKYLAGKKVDEITVFKSIFSYINKISPGESIEILVNNIIILANYYPYLSDNKKELGMIVTFRDITEVQEMANKLTGVEQYIDGLRAKSHEFMNKLQTLSGLIELKQYDKVHAYIAQTTHKQQEIMTFFKDRIKEPKITGLLLGKFQQAEELHIDIVFTPGSYLGVLPKNIPVNSIALVLGNLLQNAMDALVETQNGEIHLTILDSPDSIKIVVEDNGAGINSSVKDVIFIKGFSTKGEERGIGLHLVKYHINHILNGSIIFDSVLEEGTSFFITIPK